MTTNFESLKKDYREQIERVEEALKEQSFVDDLIKCLLNLRGNTHAHLDNGICYQLATRMNKLTKYVGKDKVYDLCYVVVSVMSLTWPKRTRYWLCPIPAGKEHRAGGNWKGTQLKLRHELIDHIIEELKARKD